MSQAEDKRLLEETALSSGSEKIASAVGTAGNSNRGVLIVAFHFPPAAGQYLPGTQRAVKLTRYLPRHGWIPRVLTVTEKSYPEYVQLDPKLVEVLPPTLIVDRTRKISILTALLKIKKMIFGNVRRFLRARRRGKHDSRSSGSQQGNTRLRAAKDFVTELFEIPDEVSGWILPATLRGRKLIRANGLDAIIATGRPWSSLVIGALLRKMTGIPLITDFRDPWMTNPFRESHSTFKENMDSRLERFVIRNSDVIIANTERLRNEFVSRYPTIDSGRFTCIPNGFDELDFPASTPEGTSPTNQKTFTLVHAGFLYGRRDPRILVDAVKVLTDREDLHRNDLLVKLIGPRELPYDLSDYIEDHDLRHFFEVIDSVPFDESLKHLASASMAILLQPNTSTQVPSKLFENIGLGKKTIAIAAKDSETARLFSDYDLGFFADSSDVENVADVIEQARRVWIESGRHLEIDSNVRRSFDVRHRIKQIADELDSLVQPSAA